MDTLWGGAADGLVITAVWVDKKVSLRLSGELDTRSTTVVADAFDVVLKESADQVRLDAAELTFIDSAGLASLVRARTACADRGIDFAVSALSPLAARVIELAGLTEVLGTVAS